MKPHRLRILFGIPAALVLLCGAASESPTTWKASGKGAAIAAGGAGSVQAGLRILRDGGNAADAAVATLLALSVTDYGSFAMGGEVPLIIYDARHRKVEVLSGQGRAPLDPKAIEWYYANGIPRRNDMKAAAVPGAVDLCVTTLRRHGTITFEAAVSPTLALLEAGTRDWHPRLAATLRKLVEAERNARGSRKEKLTAVTRRFYRGDLADELEAWYIETGSFLRKRDLAAHRTTVEKPVSVNYRGFTVYKCGPWTQGPALCQTLKILEGCDLRALHHLSADYVHTVTEALKLGLADRDEYYGDPRFINVPVSQLLSDEYASLRLPLVDIKNASHVRRPGDPLQMRAVRAIDQSPVITERLPSSDTTTCVVADRWGNVVAATPSCNLYSNPPGPLGVTHGTRLSSLNTTPNHPNRIQPGKRPRITLTPTLVFRSGKPVLAISVAGGDLQDQTTLNVLLNHVEFGMAPDQAVTAPRFATSHHLDSFNPNPDRMATFVKAGSLQLNEAIPASVREDLARRGHAITTSRAAIAAPVMLWIDRESGMIHAAGDPRARRNAGALAE